MSAAGINILLKGQYSLRRLRLRTLLDAIPAIRGRLGPFADAEHAWTVLAEAEQQDADIVEDVLMAPTVGVWLARALHQAISDAPDAMFLRVDVGWLHAVAAAAAVRCGLPCSLPVPVVHGSVYLPTVGQFRLPTSFPAGHAQVTVASSTVTVTARGNTVGLAELEPVRRHRTSARGTVLNVIIDALDPYRRFSVPQPAEPLSSTDYATWTKLLDEAWDLLTQWHPGHAEELAAGLATLVPLPAAEGVFAASSSSAFGSIAMSPKRSATEFAEALVHELQHSKLNALYDFVELFHTGGPHRFYAPWRDEPRPISGLLHGIYAFVSVVEFWDLQRNLVSAAEIRRAQFAYAYRANQLSRVIGTMRGLTELTDLGREFVDAVSDRLAARLPVQVPADIATVIDQLTADHYATWRMRHVRPHDEHVDQLIDAWQTGRPADAAPEPGEVVAGRSSGPSPRAVMLKVRALEPDRLERLAHDGPDAAFVLGDRDRAAAGYLDRIRSQPTDTAAWVGLGLAHGSPSLLRTPELVRAVHHRLSTRSAQPPDPLDLVTWFDRSN